MAVCVTLWANRIANALILFTINGKRWVLFNFRGDTHDSLHFAILNYDHWLRVNTWIRPLFPYRILNFSGFFSLTLMAYFHQRRQRRRRIPVRRVSLIVTLYYAELFPLVRRWRLFPIITVPILGMDLRPRDSSPSQFYYMLIRGLEYVSVPV